MEILLPYLHYISIMVIMGALMTEHLLLKPEMDASRIKSLATIDLIYGISALLVLGTGLLRWFVYGKGFDFYMSNPIFHIKLTLFIIMGILSIWPSIAFLRWNRALRNGEEPVIDARSVKRIHLFLRIELTILVAIPLLAVLMARGYHF